MTRFSLATVLLATVAAIPSAATAEMIDCVIEPKSMIDLGSSDEGLITEILVTRGDRVERGQLLVQLDNEIQRLQVERMEMRANSDVEKRAQETRRELRQLDVDRAQELLKKRVGTVKSFDDARIELALTQLAIEDAVMSKDIAQIEYRQAQAQLDRRKLSSPVAGIVTSVEAAPGEYAHEQLTIMQIAEVDPLHVEVFVPARMWGKVQIGQSYRVLPMAPLEGDWQATVSAVDTVFDAASGTFGVRLVLPNPDGKIPAGILCEVDMQADS
ncbi:MAG: efflux RND transporter periplasmic adaptor subunit [Pseudomonadota bacterium]